MDEGFSSQYGTPSVILRDPSVKGEEIIAYAEEIGATYMDGADEAVVLDDQTRARRIGPEIYTYSAIERSFRGVIAH